MYSFISSGTKIRFFEPITNSPHQELILIGRLKMKPQTGGLVLKPLFPSPSPPSELPLVFTNITNSTLSSNLLDEVILIRQPHLIITERADEHKQASYIRAFGHCLADIPDICIRCDSTPRSLSTQVSSGFSKEEEEEARGSTSGPIILRYISSLSSDGSRFSIRCEDKLKSSSSSSLQDVELCSPLDLWTFACGLFTVGRRIHLKCRISPDNDQPSRQIPMPVMEPQGAPLSSSCRHLIGLYNWRILSVSEVLDLLSNDAFREEIEQNRKVVVSIQGYFLKHREPSRRSISNNNRRKISLWLVDSYRHDRTTSSPLRIDFIVSDSVNRTADELLRLPRLTHLCIFKACLQGTRFILPLSPNHFQVSPNSLPSYFTSSGVHEMCRCFPDEHVNPVCSVCLPQDPMEISEVTPEVTLPRMDFLCDEKTPKTCLVQIIRCLDFKVINLEGEDDVRIILKIIISDGSATALGQFDSGELKVSGSSPALRGLATLLGLEESIVRQVITNMARVNEETIDPVSVGLNLWLASPGFLRQICLTLDNLPSTRVKSYWRLSKVRIGKDVRIAIPPMQKLRIIN
ncbi:unnamed protein product [Rodentolepis nana]|uniref:Uncharacterized protein n=1 Tax=Rodentolepis nana TaxID=102285 RepID=A0A3P7RWR6_RODNA|nr:unnamed protein product [Rodentolepis nana]